MSLMDTVSDLPLKSPTTELLFYENPLSTLLYDIRTSETHYRDQLYKLLACCSPLKNNSNEFVFTNNVRKLIAIHMDLLRCLDNINELENIGNYINWIKNSIPVYENYINNFKININSSQIELNLKKKPLIRINQLNKFYGKIIEINNNNSNQFNEDVILKQNLIKLISMGKNKIEMENLKIDLNTIFFNNVHSLNLNFNKTVAYFNLNQCIKRDFFKINLFHPKFKLNDFSVEVFQLSNNTIAICSIKSIGRCLLFPPLKKKQFKIIKNDLNLIHLNNDDNVELIFKCNENSKLSYWNNVVNFMFSNQDFDDDYNSFSLKYKNLQNLKNDKLGLGISMDLKSDSMGSALRKSSNILSKHPSLYNSNDSNDSINSPTFEDLKNLNIETNTKNYAKIIPNNSSTPKLNSIPKSTSKKSYSSIDDESISPNSIELTSPSPTLPLNIKKSSPMKKLNEFSNNYNNNNYDNNNSTISLPNFQNSSPSLNLNEKISESSIDLSKFDNIKPINLKVKKRKSIFNLFSKKLNNEPDFEIVTKSTSKPSKPSEPSSSSINNSNTTNSKDSIEFKTTPSQSMASLQKNVKNLTITTKPSFKIENESSLPSPFGHSKLIKTNFTLTNFEKKTLINSTIIKIIKNNTIVSKWCGNSWESIGDEYNHIVKFLSTPNGKVMVLYDHHHDTPDLMIPIEGSNLTKSSALDLQIKCFNSLEFKKLIMLNIRVKDNYTLNLIINEFENNNNNNNGNNNKSIQQKDIISDSNSDVFSAPPSNSTSMSSISIDDEIQESNKPLSSSASSSSQIELNSNLFKKTLLLKNEIKIKLHKMDNDEEWNPISIGFFSISSYLGNPIFSKFEINCINKFKFENIIKNSNCSRIGKSGLKFNYFDDLLNDYIWYLIEFRNSKECEEIYEMLTV